MDNSKMRTLLLLTLLMSFVSEGYVKLIHCGHVLCDSSYQFCDTVTEDCDLCSKVCNRQHSAAVCDRYCPDYYRVHLTTPRVTTEIEGTISSGIHGATSRDEKGYTSAELVLLILPGIIVVLLIGVAVAIGYMVFKKLQQPNNGTDNSDVEMGTASTERIEDPSSDGREETAGDDNQGEREPLLEGEMETASKNIEASSSHGTEETAGDYNQGEIDPLLERESESEHERTSDIQEETFAGAVPDYTSSQSSHHSLGFVLPSTPHGPDPSPQPLHNIPPSAASRAATTSQHSQPDDVSEYYHVPKPETDPSNSSHGPRTLMGNILAQPEESPANSQETPNETTQFTDAITGEQGSQDTSSSGQSAQDCEETALKMFMSDKTASKERAVDGTPLKSIASEETPVKGIAGEETSLESISGAEIDPVLGSESESDHERTRNIQLQEEKFVGAVPYYTSSQSSHQSPFRPSTSHGPDPSSQPSHNIPPSASSPLAQAPTTSYSQPDDAPERYHGPIPETPSNSSYGPRTLKGNILAQPEQSPENSQEVLDETTQYTNQNVVPDQQGARDTSSSALGTQDCEETPVKGIAGEETSSKSISGVETPLKTTTGEKTPLKTNTGEETPLKRLVSDHPIPGEALQSPSTTQERRNCEDIPEGGMKHLFSHFDTREPTTTGSDNDREPPTMSTVDLDGDREDSSSLQIPSSASDMARQAHKDHHDERNNSHEASSDEGQS